MSSGLSALSPQIMGAIERTASAAVFYSAVAMTLTGCDQVAEVEAKRRKAGLNLFNDIMRGGLHALDVHIAHMPRDTKSPAYTPGRFIEFVGLATGRAMIGAVCANGSDDVSILMAKVAAKTVAENLGHRFGVAPLEIDAIKHFAKREISSRSASDLASLIQQHIDQDESAPHPFIDRWTEATRMSDALLTTSLYIGYVVRSEKITLG